MFVDYHRKLQNRNRLPNSLFLNVQSRKSHQNESPLFASRFCPDPFRQNILSVCDEFGFVTIYDVQNETNDKFLVKRFSAHENAVFDLTWIPSNPKRFLTVSADRTAVLWDVESGTAISTFRGHQGSIKSVSACFDDSNLFATAGRDGHVIVWDARNRVKYENGIAPVNIIRNAHFVSSSTKSGTKSKPSPRSRSLETPNAVSAVLFHDLRTVVSGACKESLVRCWDLRKSYTFLTNDPIPSRKLVCDDGLKHHSTTRRAGFTFFTTDSYRSSLFSPCTDNIIYEWSLVGASNKSVACYRGATIRSFYVQCAVSPNVAYLFCGSSDNRAYIWNLHKPDSPAFYLDDHLEEVTSVAVNNRLEFVTCSDDFSWRFWRYDNRTSSLDVEHPQTAAVCKADSRNFKMNVKDLNDVEKRLENIRVTPIKQPASSPLKENLNFIFDSGSKKRSLFISPGKENVGKAPKFATPLKRVKGSKHVSVFLYPTPTFNLPNLLKDRTFLSSATEKLHTPSNKSVKKRLLTNDFSTLNEKKIKSPSVRRETKKTNDAEVNEKKSKTLLDYFTKI